MANLFSGIDFMLIFERFLAWLTSSFDFNGINYSEDFQKIVDFFKELFSSGPGVLA